jgi:hypothetical protein
MAGMPLLAAEMETYLETTMKDTHPFKTSGASEEDLAMETMP